MRQYSTSASPKSGAQSVSLAGRFSYEAVDQRVANFLKGQADRIRRQCVTSIIQIGKALLEAKRHLSHGMFLSWVEDEVRMPVRTAQTYMRVASWAEEKSATVAHLSPTVLYLLSAPSTPAELTKEVLAKAEAGELVAPATLRQKLRAFRQKKYPLETARLEDLRRVELAERDVSEPTNHSAGITELAKIVAARLSRSEIERVRQLLTSDGVRRDLDLGSNLERALANLAQSSPSRLEDEEPRTARVSNT
ncbi:DUF3102 domain-containing protein [Bradyrhizobium sp. CCBAU 21362]|uniref:DUF3102 domain-containing protein n=1 Tax=Bradyrhizobium sp. CCBAU 21362 TaxID=1325082 RepID=UPI003FA4C175